MASELVEAHEADLVRAKVEVFDWLLKRGDKRIGKNPAGYLVSSIREDYAAPEEYTPPDEADRLADAERQAAEDERKRRELERIETDRVTKKDTDLKSKWAAIDDSERDAIMAQVKTENPGLRRWKTMMEPLCLAELERRLAGGAPRPKGPAQGTLFPDVKSSK
jgi:hypothetical protein